MFLQKKKWWERNTVSTLSFHIYLFLWLMNKWAIKLAQIRFICPWKTDKPNLNQVRIWGFVSTVRDNFLKNLFIYFCAGSILGLFVFLIYIKTLLGLKNGLFPSLLWSPPLPGAQQHFQSWSTFNRALQDQQQNEKLCMGCIFCTKILSCQCWPSLVENL